MLGKDSGILQVYWGAGNDGFSKPALEREGNLGDKWYKAQIERTPSKDDFLFVRIFIFFLNTIK